MTYIKINETLYPAAINGKIADAEWDKRESKAITLEMDYETAKGLFVDNLAWSIVEQKDALGQIVLDENGAPIQTGTETKETEWDNSEYCVAGDLIDHRDGTITAKMGKLTDLEEAYEMLLGGEL